MVDVSYTDSETLTSEERWQRWLQRSRDREARFRRRVSSLVAWVAVILLAGILLAVLIG